MKKGTVVKSLTGHDKGAIYLVISTEDNVVLVCDGKNKLLNNPKRKNRRHLECTGKDVDLSKYNPLYDAHIRKELKGL